MFIVVLFNDKFLEEGYFSSELLELTPTIFAFDPDPVDPQLSLGQSFPQPHDHRDRSFLLGWNFLKLVLRTCSQDAILNLQGFNIGNYLPLLASLH